MLWSMLYKYIFFWNLFNEFFFIHFAIFKLKMRLRILLLTLANDHSSFFDRRNITSYVLLFLSFIVCELKLNKRELLLRHKAQLDSRGQRFYSYFMGYSLKNTRNRMHASKIPKWHKFIRQFEFSENLEDL